MRRLCLGPRWQADPALWFDAADRVVCGYFALPAHHKSLVRPPIWRLSLSRIAARGPRRCRRSPTPGGNFRLGSWRRPSGKGDISRRRLNPIYPGRCATLPLRCARDDVIGLCRAPWDPCHWTPGNPSGFTSRMSVQTNEITPSRPYMIAGRGDQGSGAGAFAAPRKISAAF